MIAVVRHDSAPPLRHLAPTSDRSYLPECSRQLTVLATSSLAMAPNSNPGKCVPNASSRFLSRGGSTTGPGSLPRASLSSDPPNTRPVRCFSRPRGPRVYGPRGISMSDLARPKGLGGISVSDPAHPCEYQVLCRLRRPRVYGPRGISVSDPARPKGLGGISVSDPAHP